MTDLINPQLKKKYADVIYVAGEHRHFRIFIEDIKFIKGHGVYVDVYTRKAKHTVSTDLRFFLQQLYGIAGTSCFVRVSRSDVVNLKHVDAVNRYTLLVGDEEFNVKKHYREQVFEHLPVIRTKPARNYLAARRLEKTSEIY